MAAIFAGDRHPFPIALYERKSWIQRKFRISPELTSCGTSRRRHVGFRNGIVVFRATNRRAWPERLTSTCPSADARGAVRAPSGVRELYVVHVTRPGGREEANQFGRDRVCRETKAYGMSRATRARQQLPVTVTSRKRSRTCSIPKGRRTPTAVSCGWSRRSIRSLAQKSGRGCEAYLISCFSCKSRFCVYGSW